MSAAPPRSAFTRREKRIIDAASSPEKAQRWLESLPYNHEPHGETLRTFRGVVRANQVHCLEGALCAATILEQHGYPPIVVDLESQDDLDHVVFVFRRGAKYGTVARSRDPGLHGRKPLYRSIRDLVYSYVDPFVDLTGRINGYGVLDLRVGRRADANPDAPPAAPHVRRAVRVVARAVRPVQDAPSGRPTEVLPDPSPLALGRASLS